MVPTAFDSTKTGNTRARTKHLAHPSSLSLCRCRCFSLFSSFPLYFPFPSALAIATRQLRFSACIGEYRRTVCLPPAQLSPPPSVAARCLVGRYISMALGAITCLKRSCDKPPTSRGTILSAWARGWASFRRRVCSGCT